MQAPILVVISVMIGVTDVVIMPIMHKATEHKCSREIYKKLLQYTQLAAIPLALIATVVGIAITPEATIDVIAVLFLMPLLASASGFYFGQLNAVGKHGLAALGPLYGGIGASLTLISLPISTSALAVSLLAFELFKLIGLKIHSRKIYSELNNSTKKNNTLLRSAKNVMKLQAIASFVVALNPFVDAIFALTIGGGSVSLVEYASRLWNIVPLLLTGNVILFYTKISKSASKQSVDVTQIHTTTVTVALLGCIVSGIIYYLAPFIMQFLYGNGQMNQDTIDKLTSLFQFYLIGAGAFTASQIYIKTLSAIGTTKPITIVSIIVVISNLIGNIILVRLIGLNGIALSTSITYIISLLLLALYTHKIITQHNRAYKD